MSDELTDRDWMCLLERLAEGGDEMGHFVGLVEDSDPQNLVDWLIDQAWIEKRSTENDRADHLREFMQDSIDQLASLGIRK